MRTLLLLAALILRALTLDEVGARNIEALHSLQLSGELTAGGGDSSLGAFMSKRKDLVWLMLVLAVIAGLAALLRPASPGPMPVTLEPKVPEPIEWAAWRCKFLAGREEWYELVITANQNGAACEARIKLRGPAGRPPLPVEPEVYSLSRQLSVAEWQEFRDGLQGHGAWTLPGGPRTSKSDTDFDLLVRSTHQEHETHFYGMPGEAYRALLLFMDKSPTGLLRRQILAKIDQAQRRPQSPPPFFPHQP